MINKDALEEEPIGALIRADVEDDKPWLDHAEDLLQIADEADRRERNWREAYKSVKEERDLAQKILDKDALRDAIDILRGRGDGTHE